MSSKAVWGLTTPVRLHAQLASRRSISNPSCSLFGWSMDNKQGDDAGKPGTPSKLQQLFEFSRLMFRKYRGKSMPAETVARMHQQLGMATVM